MSVDGEFARVTPELFEEIRAKPAEAYDRVVDGLPWDDHIDLERTYSGLAVLMEAEGFPVNPVTAGAVFPDDQHCWGSVSDSRSLTVAEVARAAATLLATPYSRLERHRYVLAVEQQFYRPIDEDALDARMARLGQSYPLLTAFFAGAADRGLRTIFWTA